MIDAYNQFKASVPGDALLALALFLGGTIHALRNRSVPVAEGLTGTIISIISGGFITVIACWVFSMDLKSVWFLGFPLAYMANYFLGGMDTVGAQIRDTPVQTIVSLLGTLVDEVLAKLEKYKIIKQTPK